MVTYRHLNLLIDSIIYDGLRKQSRKTETSVSKIVREVLVAYLEGANLLLKGKAADGQLKNSK